MSYNDPIGDLFTRIRNAQQASHAVTRTPASKLRARILDVLVEEGFIRGYKEAKSEAGHNEFVVELKYYEGRGVIQTIKRVSTPGRRVYSKVNDLPRVQNGLGLSILSTPQGVMADYKARAANVGGEILGQIF
ncbi:MAG: 30S ribosomal protein S8 [Micavibrio sp.]|mgnify:CR=1 FL=1|nr:30S ribosomal protein S8 [Micavibrio sp.]|tara:strand:+ start:436 stop:834 length:399 start_codon:yes stop_codon:yes gene_type:complete